MTSDKVDIAVTLILGSIAILATVLVALGRLGMI